MIVPAFIFTLLASPKPLGEDRTGASVEMKSSPSIHDTVETTETRARIDIAPEALHIELTGHDLPDDLVALATGGSASSCTDVKMKMACANEFAQAGCPETCGLLQVGLVGGAPDGAACYGKD